MNLLEHYIDEVISEEERVSPQGTKYVEVTMLIDCYGVKEQTKHIFLPSEWEKAKKDGYYLS